MTWQDVAVVLVVGAALSFLAYKLWPRSRRPDVSTKDLVRKRRDDDD